MSYPASDTSYTAVKLLLPTRRNWSRKKPARACFERLAAYWIWTDTPFCTVSSCRTAATLGCSASAWTLGSSMVTVNCC